MKEKLKKFVEENPFSYFSYIKNNKFADLKQFIMQHTQMLQDTNDFKYNFATRIYWVLNDIKEFPKCPICGKTFGEKQNINPKFGYSKTCKNKKCRYEYSQKMIEKHNIEKYGVKSTLQLQSTKEKTKQTMLKNYGVEHQSQSKIIRNKIKQTCLARYGVDNYTKTENYKIQQKKSKFEHYGNENFVNPKKCKQTKLKKYGFENYNNSKKAKQTCIKRYGIDNYSKTNIFKDILTYKKRLALITKIINNKNITLLDNINCKSDLSNKYLWQCNKCGSKIQSAINWNLFYRNNLPVRCEKCYPFINNGRSNAEKNIVHFLETFNINIKTNLKNIISPFELDIYIPEKNLAIEYDGLYWHQEKTEVNNNYHLIKTTLCEDKGIQLIHIFENEWIYKQDIIKSRLKNLLGIYDTTVFARKCIVKEVDSKTSKQFQDDNHLQGSVNAKVNLGLFYNSELVSLMTFGKCRFNKKYEWEMLRFCNKLNYHIPGGAGKLLAYFEKTYMPKSLVSYADRRWSQGKLYTTLGFKLDHVSPPNYWYWNSKNNFPYLESRVKYQKHKLKNILENFNEQLSETQNMLNNKYFKIYDCGNLVYVKEY